MKRWYCLLVLLTCSPFSIASAACKCSTPDRYDLIFEGHVLRMVNHGFDAKDRQFEVHFNVERIMQGEPRSDAIIYTGSGLQCGVNYIVGESYKVYAIGSDILLTKNCYGTAGVK